MAYDNSNGHTYFFKVNQSLGIPGIIADYPPPPPQFKKEDKSISHFVVEPKSGVEMLLALSGAIAYLLVRTSNQSGLHTC